jgi:hypothetical protein
MSDQPKPTQNQSTVTTGQPEAAEIQAARQSETNTDLRTTDGYVIDKSGKLDNRAIVPPIYQQKEPRFGFNPIAETLNGRAAMIGFAIAILIELYSGQGVLHFWGLM